MQLCNAFSVSNSVQPHRIYLQAVKAWLPEFSRQKTVWGPMSKPQVGLTAPVVPPTVTSAMVATQMSSASPMPPTASDFSHVESATAAGRTERMLLIKVTQFDEIPSAALLL